MASVCRKYNESIDYKNQIKVIRKETVADIPNEWDIENTSLIPSLSATLIFLSVVIGIPALFYLFEYLFWSFS